MAATVTVLFISYLLGSIPSAILVGKGFKGIDVREHGSGNACTTNTFRVLGVPFGMQVIFWLPKVVDYSTLTNFCRMMFDRGIDSVCYKVDMNN